MGRDEIYGPPPNPFDAMHRLPRPHSGPDCSARRFSAPPADEMWMVGAEAHRRERSVPRPTFHSRSGTARAQEHGPAGLSLAKSGGKVFSLPVWKNPSSPSDKGQAVVYSRPLQPALPKCFQSWAHVLTDWHVCGALQKSKYPRCLAEKPELAAPFVAEIGAAIRDKQLRRRPIEVAICRESVVEPTYVRSGGPAYVALCEAMEVAQHRYVTLHRASFLGAEHPPPVAHRADVDRLQSEFFACRERHAPAVNQATRASARDYWAKNPPRGMSDDFFADAARDSTPARMSRVDPAWWWRSFFSQLQLRCKRHHSVDGCFLDELPALRARATRKKLSAEIDEWSEAWSERWGWDGPGHYRMLADRAASKAAKLVHWFDACAPGYLHDDQVRDRLHGRLTNLLAKLDPWERLLSGNCFVESEHWRN